MVSIIICKFRLEIYFLCCGPPKIFHGPPKFDFVPVAPLQCAVAPRGATWPPVGNPWCRVKGMVSPGAEPLQTKEKVQSGQGLVEIKYMQIKLTGLRRQLEVGIMA